MATSHITKVFILMPFFFISHPLKSRKLTILSLNIKSLYYHIIFSLSFQIILHNSIFLFRFLCYFSHLALYLTLHTMDGFRWNHHHVHVVYSFPKLRQIIMPLLRPDTLSCTVYDGWLHMKP